MTRSSKGRAVGPKGFSAPVRGDARVVVISDLNSQYGSTDYEPEVHRAIALLPSWQPDLVLCGGDMVAGMSQQLSDAQIRAMWEGFDRAIGAPLRKAKLPLGFTIGNHDGSGAIGAGGQLAFERDRRLAQAYWKAHTPQLQFVDRDRFPFNYSFVQNEIFYLVWDASTAVISAQQLAWAEKSLKSSAAQQARMRIAIGHLPLYGIAVGRDKPGEFLDRAETLRSMLEKYRVHTYISGHDHAYFPGHRGQLQLLQTGALGTGPRRWLNSNLSPRKTLTVVDIEWADASTRYTTYDLTHNTLLDAKILPRTIAAPNGLVLRRDIHPNALTPAERTRFWG
ncbi:metallophosphoesterase family protein [Altericista sp. CCNU0014]|uniref:metallophosphoesterase family protein n=1 Tax=Altericista sp. CCNU0014 TaxID=3082949 RepID=UPI00384F0615